MSTPAAVNHSAARNVGALVADVLVQGESALTETQNLFCDLTSAVIPSQGQLKNCVDTVKNYRNEIMNTLLALSLLYCYRNSPKIMNTRVFAAGTLVGFLGSTVMQSNEFPSMQRDILGHTEAQGYGVQKVMAALAALNTYIDNNYKNPQQQTVTQNTPLPAVPTKPMLDIESPSPFCMETAMTAVSNAAPERAIELPSAVPQFPMRVDVIVPAVEAPPAYWGPKVALSLFSGALAGNSLAHILKDVSVVKTLGRGTLNVAKAAGNAALRQIMPAGTTRQQAAIAPNTPPQVPAPAPHQQPRTDWWNNAQR